MSHTHSDESAQALNSSRATTTPVSQPPHSTAVSPLLSHWRYCSLALNHRLTLSCPLVSLNDSVAPLCWIWQSSEHSGRSCQSSSTEKWIKTFSNTLTWIPLNLYYHTAYYREWPTTWISQIQITSTASTPRKVAMATDQGLNHWPLGDVTVILN